MAEHYTPSIQWGDIPIEVITDTDGNYEGVLIERINGLLGLSDPTTEVVFTITGFNPPIAEATLNENNDIHIVVKEMKARSIQNVSLYVSAFTADKMTHAKKTIRINFWRPKPETKISEIPTMIAPRIQNEK